MTTIKQKKSKHAKRAAKRRQFVEENYNTIADLNEDEIAHAQFLKAITRAKK